MMKGKVLIIEDNPEWQARLKMFIEAGGYHVTVIDNLNEAIDVVSHQMFHFITVDMQLSETIDPLDFEGWPLLHVIKKLRVQENTPVMVITGHGHAYLEFKKVKLVESLYYMEKGEFDRAELLNTIDEAVSRIDLRFNDDMRSS